jgi:hypothetical protein
MKLLELAKHKLKRAYLKKYIWYKKNVANPDMRDGEISQNEKKTLSIALIILKNDNSVLSSCPITGKRYIRYNDYFIVIDSNRIQLVNHVYGYDIAITGKQFYNLKMKFDNKLYKTFNEIENEVLSNVKHSLDQILLNVKNSND